ncbi:flagellar assembly protein A [uncultured Desulfobacter sp.]|uniref:flagellar assembly protein A n=1 Tax=uncultured Desulfobacter sp. TaxID=240139 RepID=UPI0029F47369|nr:flagellar assembly protein A [uncultured Desulfobacter sp.]
MDCFNSPADGLARLAQESAFPYFLIIEGGVEIEDGQKTILARAKEISPETQRLLVGAPFALPSFVNAINSAGIHACLPLPFTDEDLLVQVRLRHDEFEAGRKVKALQKTIQRQNKQLFQIAGNLRKKETLYADQIQQKEKEIRVLESRLKSLFGDSELEHGPKLKTLLEKENISFNALGFRQAFDDLKKRVRDIFLTIVSKSEQSDALMFSEKDFFDALAQHPDQLDETIDTTEYESLAGLLTPVLLKLMVWRVNRGPEGISAEKQQDVLKYFSIDFSDNRTQAYIRLNKDAPEGMTVYTIEQLLHKNGIIFGLIEESSIEEWLYGNARKGEKLLIAEGKQPVSPTQGEVHYYFPSNFRRAGRINPDGSIDYRDRGEVPHVEEGIMLASKIFPKPGEPGIDVKGMEIPVPEPVDQAFSAGPGTRYNEEKTEIFSTAEGEPHLDVMGVVSVNKEFRIKGDVGFETGNIDFNGNVIVPGTVKEGFKVKCVSLTAREICGAQVDVSGDLNVSMGIVDTDLINVKGNIQAKYIHNSTINSFGDLTVQKEIVDSIIYLSGACDNERGAILNSTLSAKGGIKAGTVGNESAAPSVLTVGVDEHLIRLEDKIKSRLTMNRDAIHELSSEISQMKEVDKWLHGTITENAHVQDRSQIEIRELENKRATLDGTKDAAELKRISDGIQKLEKKAKYAGEKINEWFERQDQIHHDISAKELEIEALENLNRQLVEKLENLEQISNKSEPVPVLTISKHIQSKTKIKAPHSFKIVDRSCARCDIRERSKDEGGIIYYIMETT